MTLGEYRVGINFNPSADDEVAKIKSMAAALLDAVYVIEEYSTNPLLVNEKKRLKALAMTHIEDAAMWAVKAVTKQ